MPQLDLWGDIPTATAERLPVSILAEQAALLGEKTKNVLEGRVRTSRDRSDFVYDLDIVVPVLDNYSFTVLRMKHDVDPYPVEVADIAGSRNWVPCANEQELIGVLGQILTSERVRRVVAALQTQATTLN